MGTAAAWRDGRFEPVPAAICLAFALLVQVGTNFANDYFDFVKGADTPERIGPARAVASGLISPRAMLVATALVLSLAFLVGCGLVVYGGPWLLVVGVASIICAVAYTGGPYPLGYHGWGDVFVFAFFGLVAVNFTYFVQAGAFSPAALALSLAAGALTTNLLLVNNYRDVETDERAGKRTLVVRFGRRFARAQYAGLFVLAGLVPVVLALGWRSPAPLLALLAAPLAASLVRSLGRARGKEDFNRLLAGTARLLVIFGLLLTVGVGLAT